MPFKFSKLLIDGDALVYIASSVAETRYHDVYQGSQVLSFKYKKESDELNGYKVYRQEPHPAKEVYILIHRMVNKWRKYLKCREFQIYLTPSDQSNLFRKKLYPQYKLNRKDLIKPVHYNNARNYLVGKMGAELCQDLEADDLLAIHQSNAKDTCIISHDKDLLQVPGYHFNISKNILLKAGDLGELKLSSSHKNIIGTGFKWFCAQVLCGDKADNIPGLEGVGPVNSYNLLKDCNTNSECEKVVEDTYRSHQKSEDYLLLMKTLCWLRRE